MKEGETKPAFSWLVGIERQLVADKTPHHDPARPITRVSHSLGPCSTIAHGMLPASSAG